MILDYITDFLIGIIFTIFFISTGCMLALSSNTLYYNDVDLLELSHVLQPRLEVLTAIEETVDFINDVLEFNPEIYRHKKMKTTPNIHHCVTREINFRRFIPSHIVQHIE